MKTQKSAAPVTIKVDKLAGIPYKEMAAAVDSLNKAIEEKEFKIIVIGRKKEEVLTKFVSNIAMAIDNGIEADLPQIVKDFYTNRLLPIAEGARPFATSKKVGGKNDGKSKQSTSKGSTGTPEKGAETEKGTESTGKRKVLVKKSKPADPETTVVADGKKTGKKETAPPAKKDGKKTSNGGARGNGMVKRICDLYCVQGITDTKELKEIISKEFPDTNNASTIGHCRCILGNIPAGYLKPVKK